MRFLMLRIQMTPSYWRAQCLIEKKKFFSLFDETNKLMASTWDTLEESSNNCQFANSIERFQLSMTPTNAITLKISPVGYDFQNLFAATMLLFNLSEARTGSCDNPLSRL